MALIPREEEAARYILDLFVRHFNARPTHVLQIQNFYWAFAKYPWHSSDFQPGVIYAAEQEWLEVLRGGASYRLTQKGYSEAGTGEMNLLGQCNEMITVEGQDSGRHENVRALVTDKIVLIPNGEVPITVNDAILRHLPSGIVERLIVTSPGFHAANRMFPAHYQVRYRHEGSQPAGSPGYAVHVSGENSRVNIGSVDNSSNTVNYVSKNMDGLAAELLRLREAMLLEARKPEDYTVIGAVASAEIAAKAGDASKVSQALSTIGSAAKWALGVAKEIGVEVAAETITKSIGG